MNLTTSAATRISLIYFVLASLWIWGSDWLTQALSDPPVGWWSYYIQSWKGQFFVLLTTVLLFLLVGREERRQAALLVLLQASEERWRFAIDGSDLGLWDWDVASGTVLFSTRWKSMLGYDDADVGSALSEWETRIHPEDMPRVMENVQQLLQGKTTLYSNEHRVLCKNGQYKWILDRGKVVQRDSNGQALRVIGTHTDLTELKQREAALDLHAGVFMHNLEAIVICGPDKKFNRSTKHSLKLQAMRLRKWWGSSHLLLFQGDMTKHFTVKCGIKCKILGDGRARYGTGAKMARYL